MKIVIGALAICPLLVGPVFGNSWHVATDGYDQASGSYADPFLTIQHGIDMAANGDSVLVHDGTYSGDGNRDIDFLDKKIVVMSLNDDPTACIIQCGGSPSEPHRGVHFDGLAGC
jgi:hypothetical protein